MSGVDPRYGLPDDVIPNAEISVVSYLDATGELCYATWNDGNMPVSGFIGLLELAKADLIRLTRN